MTESSEPQIRVERATAYDTIIADLEREISEGNRRIEDLRAKVEEAKRTLGALLRRKNEVASVPTAALPFRRPRRGQVKRVVLETIRAHPGATSEEIANFAQAEVDSPTRDPRKLVHSTISHLIKQGLVVRHPNKRLYEVAGHPPLFLDDDEMPF